MGKGLKFVDAKTHGFVVEPRYYFYGWTDSSTILMRRSTAHALKRAKKFLPKGYNFKIWDCKRTYNTQAQMLKSFRRRLKLMHSRANPAFIRKEVYRYGGRLYKRVIRLDTHRMGGALDFTILDRYGNELDMGTDHDNLDRKSCLDYYEYKKRLTVREKKIRANRRLLKRVMIQAGFVPYPEEWWHWSYNK